MSLDELTRLSLGMAHCQLPLPGSVRRVAVDKLNDLASVKDFGAKGNGSADDTDAFEYALASGRRFKVPAGNYLLTRDISHVGLVGMYGEGMERSNLIFDGCNAFAITTDPDTPEIQGSIFEHLSFKSTADGTYTGIKLNGRSSGFGKQLLVSNCAFLGSTPAKTWRIATHIVKGCNTEICGSFFLGRHDGNDNWNHMVHALYAEDFSTDVKFTSNYVYMADIALLVTGELYYDGAGHLQGTNGGEGWTVTDNHMVLVGTGFWSRNNGGNMFKLTGNHIAPKSRGIVLGSEGVNGSNHSFVDSNFIMKRNDSSDGYVGIESYAANTKICNNELRVEGTFASGAENQIVVAGEYTTVIGNNVCDADATGIWLKGAAKYSTVAFNCGGNNGTNLQIDAALVTRGPNAFDDQPARPRGCYLHKNGSTSIGGSYAVVPWDTAVYDPEGFHDGGGRIYIHEPCNVKIRTQVFFTAQGTNYTHSVKIIKNGGNFVGLAASAAVGDGPVLSAETPWISVNTGDYFEVVALHGAPGGVSATTYSYVEMIIGG